ncbi:MAG: hypothetical protein R3C60_00995 [Parvularculaceae bacterium]
MTDFQSTNSRAELAWLSTSRTEPPATVNEAAIAAHFEFLSAASSRKPDLVIVDAANYSQEPETVAALLNKARGLDARGGLVVLASPLASKDEREFLRKFGDIIFPKNNLNLLAGAARERLRLASLADETGERIKSIVAFGRQTDFSKLSVNSKKMSLLIAGRPSPLTLAACNALRNGASETICVLSAGQAMRALERAGSGGAQFDGALFIPHDENDVLIPLARALRRHRDHRKLPILFTSQDHKLLDHLSARDHFEIISVDHLNEDLLNRMHRSVRRTRMANSMRSFLRSHDGCGGGNNGAASAKFFAVHSLRLFNRAAQTGKPVSLAALAIEPHSATIDRNHLSAALREATRTVTRLIRAEDMISRLSSNMVVIMLPGVCADDAERIAKRLEGVVAGTLTRATLDLATINTASTSYAPGISLESAIAELMRVLKSRRNSALTG